MVAIYKAIQSVSEELSKLGIGKNNKNEQQGFKFRGVDDVMNVLSPLLVKHGLVVCPHVMSSERSESTSKTGTLNYTSVLTVQYSLYAVEDGSSTSATFTGEGKDAGDKANSKALAMAYKYFAFQTFCIPVEGQDDADAATPEPSAPANTNAAPKAPPASKAPALDFDQVLTQVKAAGSLEALSALRPEVSKHTTNPRFVAELKAAYVAKSTEFANKKAV